MSLQVAYVGGMPGGIEILLLLFVWGPMLLVPLLVVYYLYRIDKRLARLVELREE